jgi:hypothetical protein
MVKERRVKEKEKERMGKETGRTARGRGRVTARDEDRNHRM